MAVSDSQIEVACQLYTDSYLSHSQHLTQLNPDLVRTEVERAVEEDIRHRSLRAETNEQMAGLKDRLQETVGSLVSMRRLREHTELDPVGQIL